MVAVLLVASAASSWLAAIALLIVCPSVQNTILVQTIQQKLMERFTSFFYGEIILILSVMSVKTDEKQTTI